MKPRIKSHTDFLAGGLFAALGLVTAVASGSYRIGSAAAMGPGYFPLALGLLLAVLGGAIMLGALFGRTAKPSWNAEPYSHPARRPSWRAPLAVVAGLAAFLVAVAQIGRQGTSGLDGALLLLGLGAWFASRPLFWIFAAIAGFAMALKPLGLALALAVLVSLCRLASADLRMREALVLYGVLLAGSLAIFVVGIGLRIPVLPPGWASWMG